ncbi:hypothetical protein PO909_013155 [Leuciscus waleckii]
MKPAPVTARCSALGLCNVFLADSLALMIPTALSTRSVYVEFDDLEWEKREWVKVYEDFQIFLLEHQLVWAKRKEGAQLQGTKAKQIQWPALVSHSSQDL